VQVALKKLVMCQAASNGLGNTCNLIWDMQIQLGTGCQQQHSHWHGVPDLRLCATHLVDVAQAGWKSHTPVNTEAQPMCLAWPVVGVLHMWQEVVCGKSTC
jgi:hypothetical protein